MLSPLAQTVYDYIINQQYFEARMIINSNELSQQDLIHLIVDLHMLPGQEDIRILKNIRSRITSIPDTAYSQFLDKRYYRRFGSKR